MGAYHTTLAPRAYHQILGTGRALNLDAGHPVRLYIGMAKISVRALSDRARTLDADISRAFFSTDKKSPGAAWLAGTEFTNIAGTLEGGAVKV